MCSTPCMQLVLASLKPLFARIEIHKKLDLFCRLPLRGSLAALSCGEKSVEETSGTRVAHYKIAHDFPIVGEYMNVL